MSAVTILVWIFIHIYVVVAQYDLDTEAESTNNTHPCFLPPFPENGWYTYDGERLPHSELYGSLTIGSFCAPGLELLGDVIISCSDGQWSAGMPICTTDDIVRTPPFNCLLPTAPEHGSYTFDGVRHNNSEIYRKVVLHVTCDPGYTLKIPDIIQCSMGTWSKPQPECIPDSDIVPEPDIWNESNSCTLPLYPDHGWYTFHGDRRSEHSKFFLNIIAFVVCDDGYYPSGPGVIECSEGKWTHPMPQCLGDKVNTTNACFFPPFPEHGFYFIERPESTPAALVLAGGSYNASLAIRCYTGYGLVGSDVVRCINGIWSAPFPECVPYCKKLQPDVVFCEKVTRCVINDTVQITQRSLNKPLELLDPVCGKVYVASPVAFGGRVVERTEKPWHTGIYLKTVTPYMQICGGSIVRKDVVVSAAHCFWGEDQLLPVSDYAVAAGKIYRPWNNPRDENPQKSDVQRIEVPPRFQGSSTNFQDDLALVFLSSPFEFDSFVFPICLNFDYDIDREHLAEGRVAEVSGWGLTSANGVPSQTLQNVEMPSVTIERCIKEIQPGFKSFVTSDKVCAGSANVTAVCKGDSGGGLTVLSEDAVPFRYHLRGVVSTAPNDGNLCNAHSWATFTHLLKHEHFIREHLQFY